MCLPLVGRLGVWCFCPDSGPNGTTPSPATVSTSPVVTTANSTPTGNQSNQHPALVPLKQSTALTPGRQCQFWSFFWISLWCPLHRRAMLDICNWDNHAAHPPLPACPKSVLFDVAFNDSCLFPGTLQQRTPPPPSPPAPPLPLTTALPRLHPLRQVRSAHLPGQVSVQHQCVLISFFFKNFFNRSCC